MKKKIAVDICNTLADINSELEKRLGKNPNPKEYLHPKVVSLGGNRYFIENMDIFENAKPLKDAVRVMNELSKKYDILYFTARPIIASKVTEEWLRACDFPEGELFMNLKNKGELAKILRVSFAIEDSPHEIESYRKNNIDVIVIKQPYNDGIVWSSTRLKN